MNFKFSLLFVLISFSKVFFAQSVEEDESEFEIKTFASTRIICGHSVEMLPKGIMEFRIEHRFGDVAGSNGGAQNMFGFDNLTDMRIALEYGITKNFMAGFGRSRGTGFPYRSLVDGFLKYRLLRQGKASPISLSVISGATFSYMKASSDLSLVSSFPKVSHRFAYFTQVNVARHFGEKLSIALMPTLVHRNYVANDDVNDLFTLGGAARVKLTSRFALVFEYYHAFSPENFRSNAIYKNSLGMALEWNTFGHTFAINLTNAAGIGETQFIPYTYQNWLKGQFRMGFCVGRKFSLINE